MRDFNKFYGGFGVDIVIIDYRELAGRPQVLVKAKCRKCGKHDNLINNRAICLTCRTKKYRYKSPSFKQLLSIERKLVGATRAIFKLKEPPHLSTD